MEQNMIEVKNDEVIWEEETWNVPMLKRKVRRHIRTVGPNIAAL